LKTLLGALGGVILALLAVEGLSANTQGLSVIDRVMGGMMGGGVLGMLVGLLFWALVVALVVGLVPGLLHRPGTVSCPPHDAQPSGRRCRGSEWLPAGYHPDTPTKGESERGEHNRDLRAVRPFGSAAEDLLSGRALVRPRSIVKDR
jgi:hypothetical protein